MTAGVIDNREVLSQMRSFKSADESPDTSTSETGNCTCLAHDSEAHTTSYLTPGQVVPGQNEDLSTVYIEAFTPASIVAPRIHTIYK